MKPEVLKKIFKGKVVIMGMGNILRGDDGLGPLLVERLKDKLNAVCMNAETAPENYLGKIEKINPDTLIIIDAVDLNLVPGDYAILKPEDLLKTGFTTHDISPLMLVEYLRTKIKAETYVLGVQPQKIGIGDEISERVKKALNRLEEIIVEADRSST